MTERQWPDLHDRLSGSQSPRFSCNTFKQLGWWCSVLIVFLTRQGTERWSVLAKGSCLRSCRLLTVLFSVPLRNTSTGKRKIAERSTTSAVYQTSQVDVSLALLIASMLAAGESKNQRNVINSHWQTKIWQSQVSLFVDQLLLDSMQWMIMSSILECASCCRKFHADWGSACWTNNLSLYSGCIG